MFKFRAGREDTMRATQLLAELLTRVRVAPGGIRRGMGCRKR